MNTASTDSHNIRETVRETAKDAYALASVTDVGFIVGTIWHRR